MVWRGGLDQALGAEPAEERFGSPEEVIVFSLSGGEAGELLEIRAGTDQREGLILDVAAANQSCPGFAVIAFGGDDVVGAIDAFGVQFEVIAEGGIAGIEGVERVPAEIVIEHSRVQITRAGEIDSRMRRKMLGG